MTSDASAKRYLRALAGAGLCLLFARSASAQTSVELPNGSLSTTMTANVVEQARVTVPAAATFNVTNVGAITATADLTVSVQGIVLSTATKQVTISLRANAASFAAPVAGATTWSAADVSWTSGPGGGPKAWINAIGTAGTLDSGSYTAVATCNADTTSCSSTGVKFNLAARPDVKRSGSHTLVVSWKFESIGS